LLYINKFFISIRNIIIYLFIIRYQRFIYNYWGLGIGDWGLGIGDWAQSPIPNPQNIILITFFKLIK